MWPDLLLQAGLILVTVFMFLAMHNIPQKFLTKLRYRNRADLQAKRHFVLGAQLLAQARSASASRSSAISVAKQAESEATKAISLDPKDAASHILKALALDLQGHKSSALESFDAALRPPAAKSLSEMEKGDALMKRAELKLSMSKRSSRYESAIEDLTAAIKMSPDNAKTFCLLGDCYEGKKMEEEAKAAYEQAVKIEPGLEKARAGLDRLSS